MLKVALFIILAVVGYSFFSWLRHREGKKTWESIEDLPESGQYHPADSCDSGTSGMLS